MSRSTSQQLLQRSRYISWRNGGIATVKSRLAMGKVNELAKGRGAFFNPQRPLRVPAYNAHNHQPEIACRVCPLGDSERKDVELNPLRYLLEIW